MDARLLLMNEKDDVYIVRQPLRQGECLRIEGETITLAADIAALQKLARRPVMPGRPVHKLGCPIGRATKQINPGDWVHMHNMESAWIASPRGARRGLTTGEGE